MAAKSSVHYAQDTNQWAKPDRPFPTLHRVFALLPEEPPMPTAAVWTVGYGAWPTARRAERLVEALSSRGVTRLVDVRLNPCASAVKPGPYGPKPWTLQTGAAGIASTLNAAGIAYEWLVELGNPQRHDRSMTILRAHLADVKGDWPVHRGLVRLATLVQTSGDVVALLCACADYHACHRTLIARALAHLHFDGALEIFDTRTGKLITLDGDVA